MRDDSPGVMKKDNHDKILSRFLIGTHESNEEGKRMKEKHIQEEKLARM